MYFEDFVNNQEKVKIKEKDFERKIEIKEEEKKPFSTPLRNANTPPITNLAFIGQGEVCS